MITIPLNIFKAVAGAQSKDQTRPYLCGVYCTDATLVATNGVILLKYELDAPTGLTEPLIINIDLSQKAMKPPSNAAGEVYMHLDLEKRIIETYSHGEDGPFGERISICEFDIIDLTFPDYARIIPREDAPHDDNRFLDFNPDLMVPFSKASKLLGKGVGLRATLGGQSSPHRVNFQRCPQMLGVIVPFRFLEK